MKSTENIGVFHRFKTFVLDKSRFLLYKTVVFPTQFVLYSITSIIERSFQKAKTTGEKLIFVSVLFLAVLWISVISYASFYSFYLPTAEISRPVYLSFSVCQDGDGICSFPSANVTLAGGNPIQEILGSGQVYSVTIDLELPESPVNRDLGMFMVVLRMYDRSLYTSITSKRTALVKYRSLPLRLLSLSVFSPLHLLGFYEEKQILSVEMFSSYTDDAYHPSVGAMVEIQNHKVQIYSCHLNFYAKFSGLKYILHYWPVTSAIFGISFNIVMYLVVGTCAFISKRQALRRFTDSLSTKAVEVDGGHLSIEDAESEERKPAGVELKSSSQSTQTVLKRSDSSEDHPFPLVQEPADFGEVLADRDSDLMSELRQRRVP